MATIRIRSQGGREFYYLYWWEDGKQRSRSCGRVGEITAKQADAVRAEKEREIGRKRRTVPATPTFAKIAEKYLIWRRNEYPSSHYRVEQLFRTWLIPAFAPA